ncbi:MAG: biopolymer transporter ExbD [Flavobacteriales bacterium]|jgi:biopolymer transport protein ExbD|nr:biopolymer transporter ExbD [Flavobacteriaceae bacterium]MDP4952441.1 biopolymer transporter ExbD [Flavobacteriales bacterium]
MDLGQRNKVSVTGNMSSMTDLVFLLLIFFVILSTLASKGVNVDLPQSKGVTSQASKLTVSITKDQVYLVDKGRVEKGDLESILKVRMDNMTEKTLYLEVDKDVPTGATVEVIGMAKANDWKVMLGSSPKKD